MRLIFAWIIVLLILVTSVLAAITYQLSLCYGTDCSYEVTETCADGAICVIDNVASYLAKECIIPAEAGSLRLTDTWSAKLDWLGGLRTGPSKHELTETEYLDFLRLDAGRIYTACDSVNVVTDGTNFHGCGTGTFYYYGKPLSTQAMSTAITISGHDYICVNNTITECGAGNTAASGNKFMTTECCTDGTKNYYNNPKKGVACWNKQPIPIGGSPTTGVLNVNGSFAGCKLSTTLTQTDGYTNTQLVANNAECSKIYEDVYGAGKNAVCGPEGEWMETSETPGTNTTAKQIKWTPPIAVKAKGCCPADECWNGITCQDKGTYYTIEDLGYFCE